MKKIYCLSGENKSDIFYVGKSGGHLQLRLDEHIYDAKTGGSNPEKNKIILRLGGKVEIHLLQKVCGRAESRWAEYNWVQKLLKRGYNLTNIKYVQRNKAN